MRITILTIGTRGDVHPYVALGLGLKREGHQVTIGAPVNFQNFIQSHGLHFESIGSDYEKVIKSEALERILSNKKGLRNVLGFLKAAQQIKKETADYHSEAYQHMWQAAQNADMLILQTLVLPASDFAEKLNIPVVYAGLQPITPNGDFPLIGLTLPSLGRWLNKASYKFLTMLNQIPRKDYNRLRRDLLDLPPKTRFSNPFLLNDAPIPTLCGFSKHLVPRPKDWPESVEICGFWFLEDQEHWQPDQALQSFLEAGSAPIFIGFSSLTWQAEAHTKMVVEGVKQWGGRAVIATGWGGLDPQRFYEEVPENIFTIKKAPHSKLFPLMQALVHHGGAGSTGAALLAQKPTLIVPDMVDQPFWADQVYQKGIGPKPVLLSQLTAAIFAQKLQQLTTTPHYQTKAIEIGQKIAKEDGVTSAVTAITEIVSKP